MLPLALLLSPSLQAAGYNSEVVVTPLVRTTTTTAGQPLRYLQTEHPQLTAITVEIPPGKQTGWHRHPVPCYAYILAGEVTVEVEGRGKQKFSAGQAFAESVDLLHNGYNEGSEPVKILMFATGEEDKPFTVRPEKP